MPPVDSRGHSTSRSQVLTDSTRPKTVTSSSARPSMDRSTDKSSSVIGINSSVHSTQSVRIQTSSTTVLSTSKTGSITVLPTSSSRNVEIRTSTKSASLPLQPTMKTSMSSSDSILSNSSSYVTIAIMITCVVVVVGMVITVTTVCVTLGKVYKHHNKTKATSKTNDLENLSLSSGSGGDNTNLIINQAVFNKD